MAGAMRRIKQGAPFPGPDQGNTRFEIRLRVIGRIETPFVEALGTPIQPAYAQGAEGRVIVEEPFVAALDDIEGFERVWLIYWMDRGAGFKLRVMPYRDTRERGLFATRSPCRPNPIGMSAVRLVRREERILHVVDIDVLHNTPLLDIKPYVPEFDAFPSSKAGWFDACAVDRRVADGRFHSAANPSVGHAD
jgi:tRNA-Thr(GGU) m(6)t(6)A37 methyltransferase TsaA